MTLATNLTTAPTAEPLSLTEAKAHLRVDDSQTGDDDYITALITVARQRVESFTHSALMTQSWMLYLDSFPYFGYSWPGDFIEMPIPPLQSVTQIQYMEPSAGVLTTWSNTLYVVDKYSEKARIKPAYGQVWPITWPEINAVQVEFVAGYGDKPEDVPQPLKQAMLLMIGHWYENREDTDDGSSALIPMGSQFLMQPYRALRA